MKNEDWLQDPLEKIGKSPYKRRKLKKPKDDEQNDSWWGFHFATRLKLDGADHFCRQVLGAASMPDNLGLPLLAHRHLKWYLDAFFFELMSAYDTLLQELNIIYAYDLGLKPDDVRWNKIKGQLPDGLREYMDEEKRKEWFKKVRSYRVTATHHYLVPTGHYTLGLGGKPLDYTEHEVSIYYLDNTGEAKVEKIGICKDYLKNMVKHISSVWQEMAQEFQ
jgi:hypothetical protein